MTEVHYHKEFSGLEVKGNFSLETKDVNLFNEKEKKKNMLQR